MEGIQENQQHTTVYMTTLSLSEVDLFPDKGICKKAIEPKKPSHIFLQADLFLNKLQKESQKLIDKVDNALMFDDTDSISDYIDDFQCLINNLSFDIEYLKENPYDILYDFEFVKTPKFRRYASNKRVYKGIK